MSLVRVVGPLRFVASTLLHKHRQFPPCQQLARQAGSVIYRGSAYKESRSMFYVGEAFSFLIWYWILYHCWFEYNHLVPSYVYPNPSSFTDEELGIPPDDEE